MGNSKEAEVVRKIFSWLGEERVTIREVVQRLNMIPIITRTGKNYWRASTVCHILKNPAYIGQAAFGKRKVGPRLLTIRSARRKSYSTYENSKENWIYIAVPSIINEDLFNTVQEQLTENRQRVRARRRGETFLLQGLIVCQRCTHAYCGTHGHNRTNSQDGKKLLYYYYRCNGTDGSKINGKKACDNKGIRTDVLDTVVWEEVKSLLKEPGRVVNEYQRRIVGNKGSMLDQTLEKQENKLKRGITKLIDSYTQEYITQEEFEPRVKAMRQHLKKIEEQKEKVLDQKKLQQELSLVKNSLKNFSSNIESKLDQLDWQAKRSIIRTLVTQIEINYNNLYIAFRIKELANSVQNRYNQNVQHCTSCLNSQL